MTYELYHAHFEQILSAPTPPQPYDDPMYLDYTKLNRARMKRWDQQFKLSEELVETLKTIPEKMHWIIITEPWCGDAAHLVPCLVRMAQQNDLFTYEIQLRDQPPHLIEQYLTGGSRSIPKLVVRDENGKDLFTWGPRPAGAQALMEDLTRQKADFEKVKIALQEWYNKDKGQSVCKEIYTILSETFQPIKSNVAGFKL